MSSWEDKKRDGGIKYEERDGGIKYKERDGGIKSRERDRGIKCKERDGGERKGRGRKKETGEKERDGGDEGRIFLSPVAPALLSPPPTVLRLCLLPPLHP